MRTLGRGCGSVLAPSEELGSTQEQKRNVVFARDVIQKFCVHQRAVAQV